MSDVSLKSVVAERNSPQGQLKKFAQAKWEEIKDMDEGQLREVAQKLAEKKASATQGKTAGECVAGGEIMAEGFLARVKEANLLQEYAAVGQFLKAAADAGVGPQQVWEAIVKSAKLADVVAEAAAKRGVAA